MSVETTMGFEMTIDNLIPSDELVIKTRRKDWDIYWISSLYQIKLGEFISPIYEYVKISDSKMGRERPPIGINCWKRGSLSP